MLYIKPAGDPSARDQHWHIGDAMPSNIARVMTIQADGHELALLLTAIGRLSSPVEDFSLGLKPYKLLP